MKKLHKDEVDIDLSLVKNLINEQFPYWAGHPIEVVDNSGTDNIMFRLGAEFSVRMPRKADAESAIHKECKWLPMFAPNLPLAIPEPIGIGTANQEYPFSWSICKWLNGENASLDKIEDPFEMAKDLAAFITALQAIDPSNGPLPKHPLHRGAALLGRDKVTRSSIKELEGLIDTKKALEIWEEALDLPSQDQVPVWIHGDLHYGNLLAHEGKLSAVIDFGAMRLGDPACDLMTAWNLFDSEIRKTFRTALKVDEATWIRGKAWSLSVAVHALPYYKNSYPFLADLSRYTIQQVLSD